jgi:hypothetical protein
MGSLDTVPSSVDVATSEKITYSWDTTNYCAATGDTSIEDPVVLLTDVSVNPAQVVSLPDAPSISGLNVLQILRGLDLVAGHYYTAAVTFTGVQSGQVMSMLTRVNCPF